MNKFSLCVSALFCSWEFRLCSSLTYFHGIIFMLFVWRQTISVYNAASSVEKLCCPQSAAWALDLTPNLLTGRRSEWRRGCRGTLPFSIWKIATSIYVAFSMFVVFDISDRTFALHHPWLPHRFRVESLHVLLPLLGLLGALQVYIIVRQSRDA